MNEICGPTDIKVAIVILVSMQYCAFFRLEGNFYIVVQVPQLRDMTS